MFAWPYDKLIWTNWITPYSSLEQENVSPAILIMGGWDVSSASSTWF